MSTDLSRNPRLLCVFHAMQMSLFPMAILALFYKREIGMELNDIYRLQAIFGLFVVLFEFPSGYLADRLGYKRTLLVAALLNSVGWALYSISDDFMGVVIAEAVLGIGLSLVSGADSAMLYESLLGQGKQTEFTRWSARLKFWGQSAEGTAALLAGALFARWTRAPFLAQTAIWIVGFFIVMRLVEPDRAHHVDDRRDHWKAMRGMLHTAFVANRRLRAIFLLTILMGMSTFVPVWMITLYADQNGLPDGMQGVLWASANYAVAIGALLSVVAKRRYGIVLSMVGCIVLVASGYLSLALVQGSFAAFLYLLMTFARGVFAPMLQHLEHDEIPSSDRAGFISLRSLLFRGSFLCIAPLIGWSFEVYGLRQVLPVLGTAFATLCTFALWSFTKHPPSSTAAD